MRKTLFQTYRKEFIILFVICGIIAAMTGFILIAALIAFIVYYYGKQSKVKPTEPEKVVTKSVNPKKDDDLQIDEFVDPKKLGPPGTVKKINKDPFRNMDQGKYVPQININK